VAGRKLVNEVRSGSSFMSQSDLRLHFGLGDAASIDQIDVHWPGGATESLRKVKSNQFVTITEGKGITKTDPVIRR